MHKCNLYALFFFIFHFINLLSGNFQDLPQFEKSILEASKNINSKKEYKVIQNILDKYKRPFTVLDIDTESGEHSFKVAKKYNCVCVMLKEGKINDNFIQKCENSNLNNIILLRKTISLNTLKPLGECEHFDVILVTNVSEKVQKNWKEYINHIVQMGDNIIVKIKSDQLKIIHYLKEKKAKKIGQLKNKEKIFLIKSKNHYLKKVNWLFPPLGYKTHSIHSNFNKKQLIKITHGKIKKTDWVPGINLITFKMCNGVYPDKKTIQKVIIGLKDLNHDDWEPNNMIIQGKTATLIDYGDQRNRTYSEERLKRALILIDIDDPQKIKHFFFYHCVRIKPEHFVPLYTSKQKQSFQESKHLIHPHESPKK